MQKLRGYSNQHEHQKHATPLNLMFSKKMKTLCYQNKTKRSNKKMKTLYCQHTTKRSKKECVLSNSNIGMFFHKIIMSECGCLEKWNYIGSCRYMCKAWRMLLCRTRVKTIFPFLLTLYKISSLIPTLNWAKIKKRGTHPLIWYRYQLEYFLIFKKGGTPSLNLVSIPTWLFEIWKKILHHPPDPGFGQPRPQGQLLILFDVAT